MPAKAHEFWIDPVEYKVAPGEEVVANLRVGEDFEGSAQSYIPRNFKRFQFVQNGAAKDVQGVVGDRPAVRMTADDAGLVVLIHQTTDLALTWATWEKFSNFVKHKDAEWVIDEHLAKGFDKEKVREVYSRYAKSLIAVGDGAGKDVITGMITEIVALENPYTGNMNDGINVGVLYKGKPRKAVQVEVFEMSPGGGVRVFTTKTNGKGVAVVPVKPGHKYMLDSVVVLPATKTTTVGKPFLWESLWANLTFEVPG